MSYASGLTRCHQPASPIAPQIVVHDESRQRVGLPAEQSSRTKLHRSVLGTKVQPEASGPVIRSGSFPRGFADPHSRRTAGHRLHNMTPSRDVPSRGRPVSGWSIARSRGHGGSGPPCRPTAGRPGWDSSAGGTTRLLGNWDGESWITVSQSGQPGEVVGQEADDRQDDAQRRHCRERKAWLRQGSNQGAPVRCRKMSTVDCAERRCSSACSSSSASFDRVRNA